MFHFRTAAKADAPHIASLHAENWRLNYRGILDDHYLDNELDADRNRVWEDRFSSPQPDMHVILAEHTDGLIGFGCIFFNENEKYGSYLDNLHVLGAFSGRGVGKRLISLLATEIVKRAGRRDMYLWVLKENIAAIRLYEKLEGQRKEILMERELWEKPVVKIRYYWPDVAPLLLDKNIIEK